MKNLPESERPYERFRALGAEALSDAELLAIILKTGTREYTALELAQQLLLRCQGNLLNLYMMSCEELLELPGVGPVKAVQLKAVAELSRRLAKTGRMHRLSMKDPASIADYYMEDLRHRSNEAFLAAFFDAKCAFLGDAVIASGGANYAFVPLTELFREALKRNAVQLVVLHNHPSGDPHPSGEDEELTGRIHEGARLLGLTLADHIVIGDRRYFSFHENQLL